ncbi:FHA domain-containing protein [Nocardioides sp. 31GB23]|uniref:FHA domain-containing protein n=1 Tax=Nocardioides sp. 31GB23 TaxID=3156065 RepID=UPI0032AF7AC0
MRVAISVVSGDASTDVLLEAPGSTPAAEVEAALRRLARAPRGTVRVQHPLLGDGEPRHSWDAHTRLDEVGLLRGARVVLGERHPLDQGPGSPPHGLELHVVSGPDAGSVHPLPEGVHQLGRSGALSWQDHSLSRRHCLVSVTPAAVGVTDLGSSNGTRLDGRGLLPHEPRTWRPGEVLAVGDSLARVRPVDPEPAAPTPPGDGRLLWRRPPPRPAAYAPAPVDPAQVGASATPRGRDWPRRWERRPADPDHLLLRLGTVGHHDEPVLLALRPDGSGGPVGLVGPDDAVEAALRWWLLQLGALHAPADLSLEVAGPRVGPAWSWSRWLPHDRVPEAGRPHLRLRHGYAGDGSAPAPDPSAAGPVVVTGPDVTALPRDCADVVEIGARQPSYARLLRPGRAPRELRLDGVSAPWADRVARSLAPMELPGRPPAPEPAHPRPPDPPGVRLRPWRPVDPAAPTDWPSSRARG